MSAIYLFLSLIYLCSVPVFCILLLYFLVILQVYFKIFSVDFHISNCQQDNYELEKLSRLYFKKESIVTNFIFSVLIL